ncbi:MAG: sugar transferase [Candidatus Magasanikbacteria bacterium CG_4_9_14_3_um_filter_32_9]|uniref:Sugar transferase n=1 Tax=Candidatus Magasanikbacteria bacterium CG_4_9_14_3_um_filter_32_9 TaxID=1974644 RepID=A0A2M7Z6R1_9BACT|nr:MAG: sugar transferase [Candidatus Magasanikbacteria bacterium CG_4_9_14_3_um_filter_32_9]
MVLIFFFLNNMKLAPIVLFVYRRVEHTKKTVKALLSNELANKSKLIIFSDGWRGEEDYDDVKDVRNYLYTISGFDTVEIIESPINKGLAKSVIEGVTKVVNEYGNIIVLEDDIVVSQYFLNYMNEALNLYYGNKINIMHINGYFFQHYKNLPNYFLCGYMLCWGWATWKDSWKNFSYDVDKHLEVLDGWYFKKNMYIKTALSTLKANKLGKISTWAAFWQASITENKGLCLTPDISYTINIGHDGTGENSLENNLFDVNLNNQYIPIKVESIKESKKAIGIIGCLLKKSRGSFLQRIIRRIKNL